MKPLYPFLSVRRNPFARERAALLALRLRAERCVEPDSSFRTVPAQGQGRPATGDQDGEGRGIGQVPQPSLQRHCSKLVSGLTYWVRGLQGSIGPRLGPVATRDRRNRPFCSVFSPWPAHLLPCRRRKCLVARLGRWYKLFCGKDQNLKRWATSAWNPFLAYFKV